MRGWSQWLLAAAIAVLLTAAPAASQRRSPPANSTIVCISVAADREVVDAGEQVKLTANATDADGDVLRYTWTASDGRVVGNGSSAILHTDGLKGFQVVTALVNDGDGHTVECSASVLVVPRPTSHPQVFFVTRPTWASHGAVVSLVAREVAPVAASGPYRYVWTASAGTIMPSAANPLLADLDTTGAVGAARVELTVVDGKGVRLDHITTSVYVGSESLEPRDQLAIVFKRRSAQLNNAAVATLAFAADRIRRYADKQVVIDGHCATDERPEVATARAEAARDHLVTVQGLDPATVSVRVFADRCPLANKDESRRVVVYTIPRDIPIEVYDVGCRAQPLGP